MVGSIWPESNGDHSPLPAPNVVVARSGTPPEELSPEAVKGILVKRTEPQPTIRLTNPYGG